MPVDVYLEVGVNRVFAGALDWPGWCRSARNEEDALDALLGYGSRYAAVLKGSGVRFTPPAKASTLEVVERLKGDATTDFGAPSIAPEADARSTDRRWLPRPERILRPSWKAFDRAADGVGGELEKGPRGGGRELDAIMAHVVGAEASYARMIGATAKGFEEADAGALRDDERAIVLEGLERAVIDGAPARGPR